MKKSKMMTGLGIGAAACGVAAMAAAGMSNPKMKKAVSKKAGKAMKQMSDMISDASYLFK